MRGPALPKQTENGGVNMENEKSHSERQIQEEDGEGGRIRTCAYCVVSSLNDDQEWSIQRQIDELPKKIRANPDLEFTGMYIDDVTLEKGNNDRVGFKLLMQNAYEGRFEQIYTKSLRKFARNILECLSYLEELKKLGINVFFEEEGLNSKDSTFSIQYSFDEETYRVKIRNCWKKQSTR